jgi:nucleotide-binding universal stress UspA family protein
MKLREHGVSRESGRVRTMIPEIKKILYATDLSKNSSYAFYYAINLARKFDAKIAILHAVEPIPLYSEAYAASMIERVERQDREKAIAQIHQLLEEFCHKVESRIGAPCLTLVAKTLVLIGHPVEEILKVAEEEGCDIIVLGSHGKGFLKQTFLGSVSSTVLHRSRKPVFIIPIPSEKMTTEWDEI